MSEANRVERIAFIVVAALFVACCIEAIWAAPYIPATDMPGHLYGAVARAHIDDVARDYGRFLVANRPVTANGLIDFFAWLEPSLGWRHAYRATATLLVVAWVLAAGVFVVALDRRRAWLAFLAASTAFGWSFYAGFFAFCFATALGFAFLALVLVVVRRENVRFTHRALLALALLVVSVAHFFAAFLSGVVWLAIVVARAPRETRMREALWTCACGVPAALVVVSTSFGAVGVSANLIEELPLSLRLAAWGEAAMGGPLLRQLPLLVAMACAIVFVAARWPARTRVDRALAAVAALFLAVPLVVPWSALGWQHLSPRPLPLAALLLCAIVPIERAPRLVRVAAGAACVLAAFSSTLWARSLHVRASADLEDVLTAVDTPLPSSRAQQNAAAGYRWPFILVQPSFVDEASLFRWDPLRGMGNLFAITQGGFPAYAFVNSPTSDAVLLRPEAEAALAPPLLRSSVVTPIRSATGDERRARIDVLASHAVRVDGVILVEEPADHARWQERGYVVDVEHGRVLLAHFEGCALDVKGATREIHTRIAPSRVETLTRSDDVRGDARLEALPCGAIEVEGCGSTKRTLQLQRGVVAELVCSDDDAAP